MPRFHYKVELADGSIAKRSSERVYTHLIEISPRTLESFVKEENERIATWQNELDKSTDKYITEQVAEQVANRRARGIPEDQVIAIAVDLHKWYVARREETKQRIADHIAMRDVAIADGHPTVGNYFASNWCGSLELAKKKLNSGEIRYWTARGRTARIVPTVSADQAPIHL